MLKLGSMVTYKEPSLKLAGYCGIIEETAQDQPNEVWVRWLGDPLKKRENIIDLEEI